MKLSSQISDMVATNMTGGIGEFRIKNSAKAFDILSSGLYSNKILAIVRELGCNARDSHVAAGKADLPFTVHVPNTLAPDFWIRDYGVGLDDEEVRTIYSTYFESTKTDSNDYIGALGLGSKSPFSYTTNFSVTAIKNGVKRVYSAFISNEGTPSIVLLDESETDECNGVEVRLAVKSKDFADFRQEISKAYVYFAVKPEIVGVDIKIKTPKYNEEIVPGVFIDLSQNSYHRNINAIMGGVAYPVDKTKLKLNTQMFGHGSIDMYFDIGELDIQASREGLGYTPVTIEKLESRLKLLDKHIKKIVDDNFTDITGWQMLEKIEELKLSEIYNYAIAEKYKIKHYCGSLSYLVDLPRFSEDKNISLIQYNLSGTSLVRNARVTINSLRTRILVTDEKISRIMDRIKLVLINDRNIKDIIIVSPKDPKKPIDLAAFKAATENYPEKYYIASKDLPKPPKRIKSNPTDVLRMTKNIGANVIERLYTFQPISEQYITDTITKGIPLYYVPLSGHSALTNFGDKYDVKKVYDILSRREMLPNLVFIRGNTLQNIDSYPELIILDDYIADKLRNYDFNDLVSQSLAKLLSETNSDFMHMLYDMKDYLNNDLFKTLISSDDNRILSKDDFKIIMMSFNIKLSFSYEDLVVKSDEEAKKIIDKYPLIQYINKYSSYKNHKAKYIADYINLIDDMEKEKTE